MSMWNPNACFLPELEEMENTRQSARQNFCIIQKGQSELAGQLHVSSQKDLPLLRKTQPLARRSTRRSWSTGFYDMLEKSEAIQNKWQAITVRIEMRRESFYYGSLNQKHIESYGDQKFALLNISYAHIVYNVSAEWAQDVSVQNRFCFSVGLQS